MNTAFNPHRQNYVKYDDNRYLLYLNEQVAEQTDENGDKVNGYTYTGEQPDGSTMIAAEGVTGENRRDKFVAGLIGLYYDIDAQIAVLANGSDTPEHAAELARFMELRARCKSDVDGLLERNI